MGRLIGFRFAGMALVLLMLTLAVFLIQAKLPADPVAATLGGGASQQLIVEKRHELGYDRPIWVQYGRYLERLVHGDLGTSLRTHTSVAGDIAHFAPATIELAFASILWMIPLALGLGIWSAMRARGAGVARVVLIASSSAPAFFLAILFILIFFLHLRWLPSSGQASTLAPVKKLTGFLLVDTLLRGNPGAFWDAVQHLVLPSLVIAIGPSVSIARVMRGTLIDVMRQDHIRTARSKGLSELGVLLRHALRNSMTPVLSMAGLQVGLMLTGVIVVETVFAWPGLGLYTANALQFDDFPAVMGVTLVFGVSYVLVNAVVDILQMVADPRMKGSA